MTTQKKGGSERLATLLRERRESVGLTRRDLADSTGLSYPYISQLETGYRFPSPKAMRVLADALGLDPAELLDTTPVDDVGRPPSTSTTPRRTARAQFFANPVARPAAVPGDRDRALAAAPPPDSVDGAPPPRDAVRTAVEAIEALPVGERLEALNRVQAVVVAGLVDERRTSER